MPALRTGGEGDGAVASGRGAKLGSALEACEAEGGDVDAWDGGSAASAGREAEVGSAVSAADEGSVDEGSAVEVGVGESGAALVCACAVALQQTRPQISNGPANLIMRTKHGVFVSDTRRANSQQS